MILKEALDFVVQQVQEQAARENILLTSTEVEMLRFSEVHPPVGMNTDSLQALNQRFEAECQSSQYESKIAKLLQHSYAHANQRRSAANWQEAIRTLEETDVYIGIMLDQAGLISHRRRSAEIPIKALLYLTLVLLTVTAIGYWLTFGSAGPHWGDSYQKFGEPQELIPAIPITAVIIVLVANVIRRNWGRHNRL